MENPEFKLNFIPRKVKINIKDVDFEKLKDVFDGKFWEQS